jgi:hypothetical protein
LKELVYGPFPQSQKSQKIRIELIRQSTGNIFHSFRIIGTNFLTLFRVASRFSVEGTIRLGAVYSTSSAGGKAPERVRERRIGSLRKASRYAETPTSINSTATPASKCRFIGFSSDHSRSHSN